MRWIWAWVAHHCIVTLHLEHLLVAHSVLGAPEDVGLAHHHVMGIHHRTWLCSKPWLLVVEHLCSLSLHFVVEAVVVVMPSDPRLLSLVPSSRRGSMSSTYTTTMPFLTLWCTNWTLVQHVGCPENLLATRLVSGFTMFMALSSEGGSPSVTLVIWVLRGACKNATFTSMAPIP